MGAFLRELAGDVFSLDSRLWRTLWLLIRRPGFLTQEYFAGRRARYVAPLRLYLFTAIVFFAVMAVTGGGPLRIRVESSAAGTSLTFGQGEGEGGGRLDLPPPATPGQMESSSGVQRWLSERAARVRERPDDFNAAVFATLSNIHFLLLPIFAFLMRPFWRRRYYVEHLVFAVHAQAFLLLMGTLFVILVTAVPRSPAAAQAVQTAAWIVLMGYLFLAVRRVYSGRWWTAGLKVLVFSWVYMVAVILVVIAVAFATMALF